MYTSKRMIIFVVSLALCMDALDVTILNTAIPSIAKSLHVGPIDVKIALISYLLSLAVFIPISGWIADKFGIKRVFMCALSVFTLSSIFCGFATSLMMLVIGRTLQGIGGSLMMPLGRLIILHHFKRHEFVDAMNAVIVVVSIALMLGPLAGGLITDHFSWPWIFWVNLPFGILTLSLAAYFLSDEAPKAVPPLDIIGFILFGGGLALLTFSLSELSVSTANEAFAVLLLICAFAMLIAYFIHAKKHPHPIINVDLFKLRTFRTSVFGNLLSRLGFGGMPFLLPLLLQVSLGLSAQLSGLLIAPMAIGILITKPWLLRLLKYFGYKRLLILNTFLVALCLWSFELIHPGVPLSLIACLTFVFGLLISIQYGSMNSLAYADLPSNRLSAASSMMSTTQQLSQSFGIAVSALLLRFYSASSTSADQVQYTTYVFHQTFLTLGFLTLLSTLIFRMMKTGDGHQMLSAPAQDKVTKAG